MGTVQFIGTENEFHQKKRTSSPILAKPIPRTMVTGIGIKAINIIPPYTHSTVSPTARTRITIYKTAKKAMDTIAKEAWVLNRGEGLIFILCHSLEIL